MKKFLTPVILLFVVTAGVAQSGKKEPPPPPPKPPDEKVLYTESKPPVVINKKLLDAFYKRNPSVEKITSEGSIITLNMKDGKTEKYDMNKKEEDKIFTGKYGVSPIPPPPPPPKKKLS